MDTNTDMHIEKIKQLAQLFEQSSLTALELCEGATKIRMERSLQTVIPASPAPAQTRSPESENAPAESGLSIFEKQKEVIDFNYMTEVKAPMVGVFYAAPSPDAEPYVRRGDQVKKGDVLCIIEAMKLLNEIVAENDGEVADVCAQNGQVVEFSQTLFKLC